MTTLEMYFLSLSNPWPWAIFHPDPEIRKDIENRSWPPPIARIGKPIAIHAAKSWDADATRHWIKVGIQDFPMRKDLYPSSAVIGIATIDRVRTGSPDNLPADLPPSQRKWFFGEYGWYLTGQIKLAHPIPMKGGQGLRKLDPGVLRDLVAQIPELPSMLVSPAADGVRTAHPDQQGAP